MGVVLEENIGGFTKTQKPAKKCQNCVTSGDHPTTYSPEVLFVLEVQFPICCNSRQSFVEHKFSNQVQLKFNEEG